MDYLNKQVISGRLGINGLLSRHLLNATVPSYGSQPVFKPDGTTRHTTLRIVNLRPSLEYKMKWEEVGSNKSIN